MAEANEPTQAPGAEGGDGANQEPPVDYKALYEAEKKHSREWEKKAKANRTAAAALEEANNANKIAEDQIADLKKRLDDGSPYTNLSGPEAEVLGCTLEPQVDHGPRGGHHGSRNHRRGEPEVSESLSDDRLSFSISALQL